MHTLGQQPQYYYPNKGQNAGRTKIHLANQINLAGKTKKYTLWDKEVNNHTLFSGTSPNRL